MLGELAIIFVLILANGLFAGAEIAIVSVRKSRLQEMVDAGSRGAQAVLRLREEPERFLATVQVGITVVSATAAAFGGRSIAQRIEPMIEKIPWLAGDAQGLSLALVIILVSYLSIVVGELVPKSLALRGAERYATLVAKPLLALSWLARPIVWFLTVSSNAVLRPLGDRTTFIETRHSADELQHLVEEASKAGTVHPHAAEIVTRALEFPELTAADVMIPREDVALIRRHAPPEEVQHILLEHAHTRMPVYEGRVDNIVGYVHVKDLLFFAFEQKLIVLEDVMRPPYFVPETQPAVDLLQDMRTKRVPFVIVVDEQGSLAGIVTLEDLIEELVGDIFSELTTHAPDLITREKDGAVLVAGSAPLREINRALELELPEEGDWTTIAGLAMGLAGHIPVEGEKIATPAGVTIEVVDATPRKVRMVRLHLPKEDPAEPEEEPR